MARPKRPLINRRGVLEAALQIIDDKGLDALNIRQLGHALGVNGTSLYHYFSSKEEILVGAAQLALEHVSGPVEEGVSWRTWLPAVTHRYRTALVAHPGIIPIVVRRNELGLGTPVVERQAKRLLDEGVPPSAVVPLLDALESFVVGSALQESVGQGMRRKGVSAKETPVLAQISKVAGIASSEVFDLVIASVIEVIVPARQESPRVGRQPRTG